MSSLVFQTGMFKIAKTIDNTIRDSSNCDPVIINNDRYYIVDVSFEDDHINSSGMVNELNKKEVVSPTNTDSGTADDVEIIVSKYNGENETTNYKVNYDYNNDTISMSK
jgi:hypothetical protein